MDVHRSPGASRDGVVHLHRWRGRAPSVELADAVALRSPPDHLLAGARTSSALPDPFRRTWTSRSWPQRHAPPHGRALGADDPRGTRTIPRADDPRAARALPRRTRTLRIRAGAGREGGEVIEAAW